MKARIEFENTEIDGLKIIHPLVVFDERGFLMKTYEKEVFAENGITLGNSEDITTCSKKNVIRGMHFQFDHPQDKYITVSIGKIYDVVVDLRRDSKTFGKWKGILLSEENKLGVYIPKGFAHGFRVLSDVVKFHYRCGGKYMPDFDSGIIWNDEKIGIDWGSMENPPLLSERDKTLLTFQEFCEKHGGF